MDITGRWKATPHRELDRARDSDRFIESEEIGDYPVYGGRNIYQYLYDHSLGYNVESPTFWSVDENTDEEKSAKRRVRERTFRSGDLKKALYSTFGGTETSKSQKQFVNNLLEEHRDDPLQMEDTLLDCTEYRLVYREVARASDERTMI